MKHLLFNGLTCIGLFSCMLQSMQFDNILDDDSHLILLCHYAKTNDEEMFINTIKNEHAKDKKRRINILEFFGYIESDIKNTKQNMFAYQGIGKKNRKRRNKSYFLRQSYLSPHYYDVLRIIIINNPNLMNKHILERQYERWYSYFTKPYSGTIIHFAALHDLVNIIPFLVSYGADINAPDQTCDKNTPLHLAVKNHHYDCVKKLLIQKADINKQNKTGNTALHIAAQNGNNAIISLLIKKGAIINDKNNHGESPLHVTSNIKYPETVLLLIQHGADPQLKNFSGHLAMQDDETEYDRDMTSRGFRPTKDGFEPQYRGLLF